MKTTQQDHRDRSPEEDCELTRRSVDQLMEHFDSVQVFCTRRLDKDGNTRTVAIGDGNWYARYGQVREWVLMEEAKSKDQAVQGDD